MSSPLIGIGQIATHETAAIQAAQVLGFSSPGEIERFLFKAYGKAMRKVPSANRPKGAIFFLEPPAVDGVLAQETDLIAAIQLVQMDIGSKVHSFRLDLAAGATPPHDLTSQERAQMSGGMWTQKIAGMLSEQNKKCVVWADGVSVFVYLDGSIFRDSSDVVDELPAATSRAAALLPWDDGALAYEFATHELNDTSRAGIWFLPDKYLLVPKPELLMSRGLGKFLRTRMAGYWSHADEPYIDNSGRADIVLKHLNGQIYLVEVKWTGRSLSSTQQHQAETAILKALSANTTGWFTTYDDSAFDSGIKQLKIYFSGGGYDKTFLVIFDCCQPASGRGHEHRAVVPAHVAPHPVASFCAIRACADPRKASKVSKASP